MNQPTLEPGAPDFVRRRQPVLDVARGLAVLGMAAVHMISDESTSEVAADGFWRLVQLFCTGKASATFCVLAGITWSLQVQREGGKTPAFRRYYVRRIVALTVVGLGFAFTAWDGQILTYFALYMVLCYPLLQATTRTIVAVMVGLLALTPVFTYLFGHFIETDWDFDEYTHLTAWDFGWGSLRYQFVNGSHSVVPWLIYPLTGILLGRIDWSVQGRAKRMFKIAFPTAFLINLGALILSDRPKVLGELNDYIGVGWTPPTVLFPVYGLSAACSLLGFLWWWEAARGTLPRALLAVVPVGRLALTHYLLHVYLGLGLLVYWYPFWNWPPTTGGYVWLGYCGAALLLSPLWLRFFAQGPFEALLRAISGRLR